MMKGAFNYDGRLMEVMRHIMYVVSVNLLFLVCSLPVFTAGASASAMYTVLFQYHEGKEPAIIREFLQAFKHNFKKATAIWVGMLLILLTLGLNYLFLYPYDGTAVFCIRILLNLIMVLWIMAWIYIFPGIALYENSCRGYVESAVLTAISRLPYTILMAAVWGLVLMTILFLAQFFSLAVLLLILCGFSLPAEISIKYLLRTLTSQSEEKEKSTDR